MALNTKVHVLTQPGATGNVTISLPANFDPKAVIAFGTPQAADGTIAHSSHSVGFGTYRGGTVVQKCNAIRGQDAATVANVCRIGGNSLVKFLTETAGSTVVDCQLDLVSMQTGATSQVVVNWVNLHTRASIRVTLVILGGSDITDALVGSFNHPTTAANLNVTVASGFGQPDLIFFNTHGSSSEAGENTDIITGWGWGIKGQSGRGIAFTQLNGNTSSVVTSSSRTNRCIMEVTANATTYDVQGQLDTTVANWPTDGFRVLYDANPAFNDLCYYLALKGTFSKADGSSSSYTAGTPPQNRDHNVGFAPKGAIVLGRNLLASSFVDATAADAASMGIGAYDGTQESWAAFHEDDALGTMDSNMSQTTAKLIQNRSASGATVLSDADGVFTGNIFRTSWTTIDTLGREYHYLVLGDAPPSAVECVATRGRNDDGNETTATWKAATNTQWTQAADENLRIRFELQNGAGGTGSPPGGGFLIHARKNSGAWFAVPAAQNGTDPVYVAASPNIADNDPTTDQLGVATGTFSAGKIDEANGSVAISNLVASGHTEIEFVVKVDGALVTTNDIIDVKVVNADGTDVNQTTWASFTVGSSLTKVSATRTLQYNMQARAAQTRQLQNSVRAIVSQTRQLQAQVKARTTQTRTLQYQVNTRTTNTRALQYAVNARAAQTRALQAQVKVIVSNTRTLQAQVKRIVSQTRTIQYQVPGRASAVRTIQYGVSGKVSGSRVLQYGVAGRVSATRALQAQVKVIVAGSRALQYQVVGRINQTRTLQYGVAARATNTRQVQYGIAGKAIATRALQYQVLKRVTGTTYVESITGDAPDHWWRFNETSGTNADDAIGSSDGTYVGSPTLGQTGGIVGDPDKSVYLDGVNDRITTSVSLSGYLSAFTIEAWVKNVDPDHTDHGIAGWWNGSGSGGGPMIWESFFTGNYGATITNVTSNYLDSGVPPTGGWDHVVYTYDGTTYKLYVNGTLRDSKLASVVGAPGGNGTDVFEIGSYFGGTQTYIGNMDEVALYARALTQAEVTEHWDIGHNGAQAPARTLLWAINQRAERTRTIQYAMAARATQTRTVQYGIAGKVTQTRQVQYQVKVTTSSPRSLQYAVNARSSQTRTLQYQVNQTINRTRALQYSIAGRASQTRTIQYQVPGRVASTRQIQYTVIQVGKVSQTRTIQYAVNATVNRTRTLQYQVKVIASRTRTLQYGINTRASSQRVVQYGVVARASQTRTLQSNVYARTSRTRTLQANVYARAAGTRDIRYAVSARVAGTRELRWSVEQVGRVSQTAQVRYVIRTRTTKPLVVNYLVRNDPWPTGGIRAGTRAGGLGAGARRGGLHGGLHGGFTGAAKPGGLRGGTVGSYE